MHVTSFIPLILYYFIYIILLQSCLVGIIVPDPEVMPSWAQKKGIDGCYDDLCQNVVSSMQKINNANETFLYITF